MRHWSESYHCTLCGKTFRSYAAEARHRHNAPALCKPKRVKAETAPLSDITESICHN